MENHIIPELIRITPAEVPCAAPFRYRLTLQLPDPRVQSGNAAQAVGTGSVLAPEMFTIARGSRPVLKPISMHETAAGPVIIDGHRRMQFAWQAGIPQIAAFIYPADTPKEAICELVLSSALESGDLSGVERTLAAYKIALFLSRSHCAQSPPFECLETREIPAALLPPLAILFKRPVSERFLLNCFEILRLNNEELELLDRLGIQVEHILPLLELTTRERVWLLEQKRLAPMSTAEMRKLARLLSFARSREGFDLAGWDRRIHDTSGPTIRGADLIGLLKREIYPELSRRERNIAAYVRDMELPGSIKIKPPENLEGDSFSCYFTFSSSGEFRRYMNILRWAGGDGKIKKIVDELNSSSRSKE